MLVLQDQSYQHWRLNNCKNELIFAHNFMYFELLSKLYCEFLVSSTFVLMHLFYGPSFPTPVPVRGSRKTIPAVSDSRSLPLLLRVERLISANLSSSNSCMFLKPYKFKVLAMSLVIYAGKPTGHCLCNFGRPTPFFCVPNRQSGRMADLNRKT